MAPANITMNTKPTHQDFIDLMKAVGMFLIIYGHIVGGRFNILNLLTQPVFAKQIGVAFFVFITGWGLANNTRPPIRAVFNRIFQFYFFGILFAVFISGLFLFLKNDTNPTNYLPFFLGINVFLDYFPANPTTWYIGTYLHLLLFWFYFMQGKTITRMHLVYAFVSENIVRCILLTWEKDYIAYMLLPNWLTIFLLGMYLHRKRQLPTSPVVVLFIAAWIGVTYISWSLANAIGFDDIFPFRNITSDLPLSVPLESLLISGTYIAHTLLFFEIARRLPGHSVISFFARATLITVIIHMPIVYETSGFFYSLFESSDVARIYFVFVVFIGTAVIAEMINRSIDMKSIGNKTWDALERVAQTVRK